MTRIGFRPLAGLVMRAIHRRKYRFKAMHDRFDLPRIMTFRSWGTSGLLHVKGRVVEKEKFSHPDAKDDVFENVANASRRIESDEIPCARLEVSFHGNRQTVTADEEGFFQADLKPDVPLPGGLYRVTVRIFESVAGGEGEEADAELWVPAPEGGTIVVSDVDDTIVVTGARDALQMIRRFVVKNARTRRPFPGVAAFYDALQRATDATIFYVSRTGWNFYDLFVDFFDLHRIPAGPLIMRDLSLLEPGAPNVSREQEKIDAISEVLDAFPEHRIVLLGDSGQKDPVIYAECAARCGKRIAAIYIRTIDGHEPDPDAVRKIESHGVPFRASPDTIDMARHAAEIKLIPAEALDEIVEAAKREEEQQKRR